MLARAAGGCRRQSLPLRRASTTERLPGASTARRRHPETCAIPRQAGYRRGADQDRGGFRQSALGETDSSLHVLLGVSGMMAIGMAPAGEGHPCFHGHHIGGHRPDRERGGAADNYVLGVHRPVQQQDIDELPVPVESPSALRAAAQNASGAAVNFPAARPRAMAVDPGKAPGFVLRIRGSSPGGTADPMLVVCALYAMSETASLLFGPT